MSYKGRPSLFEIVAAIILSLELILIGFILGANWADAVEPEPAPSPVEAIQPKEVDSPPATEYAVLEGPLPEIVRLGEFKITHYCPCPICCGEWADGITYTGTRATEGRTIAVDPDVIPLGSTVEIASQMYVAEDIGATIQGKRIDVYMDSHEAALDAGVKYAEVLLYE